MVGDITYRLNANSTTRVYSIFLSAFVLYPIIVFKVNTFNILGA